MMMQNVRAIKTKKLRTIEIEQSESTPGGTSQSIAKSTMEPLSNFTQDMSGSDEDEASEVDSFILEENDIDENDQGESKFLLAAEAEGQGIQSVDPQTQARLEALLEAAGISKLSSKDGKALSDPEVLRTLTSSVSSALDEAAQALHRMRDSQGQPLSGDGVPLETSGESESIGPRSGSGNAADSSEEGESLLSLACSAGYYELAQVLLAMKANVEDRGIKGDCTPLMEAASGGHVDIVRLLLVHKADINAQSSAGNTPLHYGACGGFKEVVEELIMNGANVEIHNENGHTPLMEAASAGHVEVAKILLEHGAGINTHSNEFKESALTLACYKGHLNMVKFLLEAGADQEHKTDEMHTALMEASMDGHVEVARLLLDSGAQVNMPADSFESPLTLAACGGHLELASLLLERGANIEEVNDEGYTPLMEAAREGHEEMVALLLSQEADINAQTEETQETALTLACCGGFLEVADYLLRQGAHIELGCSTPLMEAAQEGHLELVSFLLHSGANVEAQTGTGDTALTYACENGHTDVAEALLECGAKLEHESEGGRTPLMKAARAGHLCTVQFLISKGADVNRATTSNDHTVLSLACAGGHLAVVELLLAHHADANHKLKDGSTMVIEAAKGGHTQVVKLLLEWPNRFVVNSTTADQLSQLNVADVPIEEPRVPVQGLANIVPPSEPDSQSPNSTPSFPSAIQGKNPEALRQGLIKLQKSLADSKACNKTSNPVITENFQQLFTDGMLLDDRSSEKDDKICLSPATKEEQILRKQQILEELKKVEKELHEKAHAQMLLSTQQDLEQQQQLLKLKQGSAASPTSSNVTSCVGNTTTTLLSTAGKTEQLVQAYVQQHPHQQLLLQQQQQQQQQQNQLSCTTAAAAVNPPPPLTSATTSLSSPSGSAAPAAIAKNQVIKRNGSVKQAKPTTKSSTQPPPPPPPPQPAAAAVHSVKGPLLLPLAGTPQHQALLSPVQPIVFQTEHNGEVSQIVASTSQVPLDTAQRQQLQAIQVQQQQQQQQQQQASLVYPQLTPQQSDQFLQLNAAQHMLTHQQGLQHQLQIQQISQQVQSGQHVLTSVANTQVSAAAAAQSQLSQQQQHVFQQQQQQAQQLFQQQFHQLKAPNPAGNNTIAINKPQVVRKQQQQQQQQRVVQPTSQNLIQQNSINVDGTVQQCGVQNLAAGAAPPAVDNNSLYSSVLVDSQTESNHDTALTLACAGGHAELVSLLLGKGADIEHRDKKGFTPLILSATAGHVDVVEILLDHGADIEAQSERTKDTPLSLACSGGRYEVVDLLLRKGANKEHRNVSDYTPLSLAASGGYVNIIKLLLHENAEINSRTGSKLGISPLMLAAMNGHTAAVKLLLDMGSDINAQIETNRNTALTLACFQGRHEVVSLLVDRKANIEHRAKTGLTPLMEAASGGYVEVGRVLLDKGADVNALPVPSSKDTALTIAADKGHYRFVELLLHRNAAVDVKNKKGNSPLWLACNGGHYDVVSLLAQADADIDSHDNRKVSCLMAAFRRGHQNVVKWMVNSVSQFPAESEIKRYLCTLTDNELLKKCNQCAEIIVSAKDMQAAEANKNADILLEEIQQEKEKASLHAEIASKRREKRRERRKKGKKKDDKDDYGGKNSSPEPESDSQNKKEEEEEEDDEEDDSNSESKISNRTNSLKNNSSSKASSGKNSSHTGHNNNRQNNNSSVNDNQIQQRCPEITPTSVPVPVTPTEAVVNGAAKTTSSAARANRESRKKQLKAARENRREALQESEVRRSRLEDKKKVLSSTVIKAVVTSPPAATNLSVSNTVSNSGNSGNSNMPHSSSSSSSSTSSHSTTTPSKSSKNNGNNNNVKNNSSSSSSSSSSTGGNANTRDNNNTTTNTTDHNKSSSSSSSTSNINGDGGGGNGNKTRSKKSSDIIKQSSTTGIGDLDDFGVVPKGIKGLDENMVVKDLEKYNNKANQKKIDNKKDEWSDDHRYIEKALANASNRLTQSAPSPRKGQKKEDGWKEVVRKNVSKRCLMVPANVTARLIGKGGCHINAIREISGAHVEVEKAKGMADRSVTIKGSQESIRQAHNLINAMIEEPDKDISDILTRSGAKGGQNIKAVMEKVQTQQQKSTTSSSSSSSIGDFAIGTFTLPTTSTNNSSSGNHEQSGLSSSKSPAVVKSSHRIPANQPGSHTSSSSSSSSNASGVATMGISAWQKPPTAAPGHPAIPSSPRRSPQKQVIANPSPIGGGRLPNSAVEKTSSRQLIFTSTASGKAPAPPMASSSSTNMASLSFTASTTSSFRGGLVTSSSSAMTNQTMGRMHPDMRGGGGVGSSNMQEQTKSSMSMAGGPMSGNHGGRMPQQAGQMNPSQRVEPMPLPIVTSSNPHAERPSQPPQPAEYSPFNHIFPNFLSKKEEHTDKMDFASVAAAGVVTTGPNTQPSSNPVSVVSNSNMNDESSAIDPALQAKAPGFKIPQRGNSPPYKQDNPINTISDTQQMLAGIRVNPNVGDMNAANAAVGSPIRPPPAASMSSHQQQQMMEEYHLKMFLRQQQQMNQVRDKQFMLRPSNMMRMDMGGGGGAGMMFPQAMGGIPMPPGHQQPLPPKEEYSKPHRPMTLPEIKGALNPNAPEFQLSAVPPMMNGYDTRGPMMGPGGMAMDHPDQMGLMLGSAADHLQNVSPGPGMSGMGQVSLPPMMQPGEMNHGMQFLLQQARMPSANMGGGGGGGGGGGSPPQMPGNHRLSSSMNAAVGGQSSQSHNSPPHQGMMGNPGLSPAPGSNSVASAGFIGGNGQRNPSPLSGMTGGRPNSAPGAQPDPVMNPGPIGPPGRVGSPLSNRTPPTDQQQQQQQAKQIQPIGGERKRVNVRPGGGPPPGNNSGSYGNLWNFNNTSEFNSNPEWPNGGSPVMTAAAMPSSVITSSVVGGSHMVYPQGKEGEVDGMPEYGLQTTAPSHHFKGPMGMMVGGDGDHSKRHIPNMMPPDNMYSNGPYMMGPMFPQQPKGGAGDSYGAAIWNSGGAGGGMAQIPNDQNDNERWQSWSQQAEI